MKYEYIVKVSGIHMWLTAGEKSIPSVLDRKDLVVLLCCPHSGSDYVVLKPHHIQKLRGGVLFPEDLAGEPYLTRANIREQYFGRPPVQDVPRSLEPEQTPETTEPEQAAEAEPEAGECLTCAKCGVEISELALESGDAFDMDGNYFCSFGCATNYIDASWKNNRS